MVRAIVFDAFGTLFHRPGTSAHRYALARLGARKYRKLVALSQIYSDPLSSEFAQLRSKEGAEPFNAQEYAELLKSDLQQVRFFGYARHFLRFLRKAGYRIGLVSNLSLPYRERLSQLGIDELVDESAFSCDIGYAKPDVRIFGTIQMKLQLPAQRILMIGDNAEQDIAGAKLAGFNTLLLEHPPGNILAAIVLLKRIVAHFKQLEK